MAEKKYPKLLWECQQLNYCCGIAEIGCFQDESGRWDGYARCNIPPKKLYETRREQAEACYKEFLEHTNHPNANWNEDHYTQLLVTLVSAYAESGKHQHQELQDVLLEDGWTIYSVFINPNHGNEVTLLGKYFPERHYETDPGDQYEPAEDEDEEVID